MENTPGDTRSTLADLGEDELVRRLLVHLGHDRDDVVVDAGDDCAVVDLGGDKLQLLKTDCVVEGIHFPPGTDPVRVGRKAMNRALSDIAAMGGRPLHALVTVLSGPDRRMAEVEGWFEGIGEAARIGGCAVVGGETASAPTGSGALSVSVTGEVERDRCLRRDEAKIGDAILVTGLLGGSFPRGHHLDFTPRLEQARWLVQHYRPSAAMDLSDGLGSDLPRLGAASSVGFDVDLSAIPRNAGVTVEQAIRDGEDYELLFTLPPNSLDSLLQEWPSEFPNIPLTCIGRTTESTAVELEPGWEHFR